MSAHVLEREVFVNRPLEEVFPFFSEARNLERLTPSWLSFEVITPAPIEMRAGTRIEYRLRLHRLPLKWVSRIEAWEPGKGFVDRQIRGPYREWRHSHEFERSGTGTIVRDRVRYELPFGALGELARRLFVARDLERVFDYRRAAITEVFR
jgi:hypothetical protein